MMSGARLAIIRPASETRKIAAPLRSPSGTRGSSTVLAWVGVGEVMDGPFARNSVNRNVFG